MDEKGACRAIPGAPPPSLLPFVQLTSLVERRSRACSFEKAEVELEHDQLELRPRIACLSERLAAGAALTTQIRPCGRDVDDELDACTLRIAEERVLAGIARIQRRQAPSGLLFALPKEKSSVSVSLAASLRDQRVAASWGSGRHAKRRSSSVAITSVGCDQIDALPRECGIRLMKFATAAGLARLSR